MFDGSYGILCRVSCPSGGGAGWLRVSSSDAIRLSKL